jgi:hypothetical protein
MMKISCLKYF